MAAKKTTKVKPKAGFVGEAPADRDGWFATSRIAFRGGILHQLHKRTDGAATVWWWFPVEEI
jgi:hypothetical protein